MTPDSFWVDKKFLILEDLERLGPDLSESSRILTFYRVNKKLERDERDVHFSLTIWESEFPALFKAIGQPPEKMG